MDQVHYCQSRGRDAISRLPILLTRKVQFRILKGMIDDSKALTFQADYLSTGSKQALTMLYCEVRRMAGLYLYDIRDKRALSYTDGDLDDLAHDSASRLISRYLKHDFYQVEFFRKSVYQEVEHALDGHDGNGHKNFPKYQGQRDQLPIDSARTMETVVAVKGNPKHYIEELQADHANGGAIILAIYRATSFRKAMLEVAGIAGKRWIYDNAHKLREVYRIVQKVGGRK